MPDETQAHYLARVWHADLRHRPQQRNRMTLNWPFMVERVTGIEPASRAWELHDIARTEPLSSGFNSP